MESDGGFPTHVCEPVPDITPFRKERFYVANGGKKGYAFARIHKKIFMRHPEPFERLRNCLKSLFRREISSFRAKTMRGEEGVFEKYDNEPRIVCSRNDEIAAEYGDVRQVLRINSAKDLILS